MSGVGPIDAGARRLLDEQRLGYVATVNDDGTPNLSPKGTLTVLDEHHLAFADLASPTTIRNLRARPSLEINVVDPLSRKGLRFAGRAEVLDAGDERDRLVALFAERGLSNAPQRVRAVVRVRVTRVRPLVSPAHDSGLTEAELRERWSRHYARLGRGEPSEDPEGVERSTGTPGDPGR